MVDGRMDVETFVVQTLRDNMKPVVDQFNQEVEREFLYGVGTDEKFRPKSLSETMVAVREMERISGRFERYQKKMSSYELLRRRC
jgi:hypothetical protein